MLTRDYYAQDKLRCSRGHLLTFGQTACAPLPRVVVPTIAPGQTLHSIVVRRHNPCPTDDVLAEEMCSASRCQPNRLYATTTACCINLGAIHEWYIHSCSQPQARLSIHHPVVIENCSPMTHPSHRIASCASAPVVPASFLASGQQQSSFPLPRLSTSSPDVDSDPYRTPCDRMATLRLSIPALSAIRGRA